MRVHDVERAVGERECVHVADLELDVGDGGLACRGARGVDRRGRGVDPDRARSSVMLPGPQPMSRRSSPGCSDGSRYAAEFSAVRHRCERNTLSWWPCV
jgi:hypothetical protein